MHQPDENPKEAEPSVSDLVVELLTRIESDSSLREPVLQELCSRWPSQETALRTAVANLDGAGFLEVDELPESIGEFRPIRRLGGGGMGMVLLAEQPSLGRRVAIKLLRADELLRDGSVARFQRETEAVARLAHPNVVSVHSVGQASGVPYLVMDHVEGTSLDRIIAAQAGRSPADLAGSDFVAAMGAELIRQNESSAGLDPETFEGSWIDVSLRMAKDVAEALAHAHSRGVLHRDVKPSNLMVTPAGRVLLVDFGLAAVLDAERLTKSGAQLGSLPYMPPEVLAGDAPPDARGDVYSLGVTLYELLLLELPFPGRGTKRLSKDIEEGRFVPARSLNPTVSKDLETILRCACSQDPARRYPSASALAADLDNVMTGRPISARPASPWTGVLRWAQRRPEQAALAALAATVAIGGPLTFGLQQRAYASRLQGVNQELSRSLSAETEERERADGHFWRATEAIDRVVRRIARDGLEDEPRMQVARLGATEDALQILEELRAERPDHPQVLKTWGSLLWLQSDLLVKLGRGEEGVAVLEAYGEMARRLEELEPMEPAHRLKRATGQAKLCLALQASGRTEESLPRYPEAIENLAAACQELPGNTGGADDLLATRNSYAFALMEADRHDEAEPILVENLVLAQDAVGQRQDEAGVYERLASVQRGLGKVQLTAAKFEPAAEAFGASLDSLERALYLAPGSSRLQSLTTELARWRGEALIRLGRFDEAAESIAKAVATNNALLGRFPSVPLYTEKKASLLNLAAYAESERGELLRSVELAQEALGVHLSWLASSESAPAARTMLRVGVMHANLSGRMAECEPLGAGRYVEAEEHALRAIELFAEHDPERKMARSINQIAHYNWVQTLARADREAEASAAIADLVDCTRERPLELYNLAGAWGQVLAARQRAGADAGALGLARDACLDALERAKGAGFQEREAVAGAEIFQPLQGDPRFVALLESMQN